MIFKNDRKSLAFIVFLIFSLMVYLYLYFLIPKEEYKLRNEIIKYTTSTPVKIVKNAFLFILNDNNSTLSDLFKEKSLRIKLQYALSKFKTNKIKYLFVIYKDKNKYRYLLDSESSTDVYGMLFIPFKEEKKVLDILEKKKESIYLINSQLETLGITYYMPLKENENIKAILIIDFSLKTLKEINSLVNTVKKSILYLMLFTFTVILVSLFMLVRMFFIRRKIYEDPLTKVYNRKYLADIEHSLDLKDYIVVIVDIDFFKHINDTYGHKFGDEVLKKFANILKNNLRKEDIVIRYGGEEFLLLIKKDRQYDKRSILKVVERLLDAIRNEEFNNLKITASFGVNLDTSAARSLIDAIKKADLALYKAKKEGRNRIEIYTEKREDEISLSDLKEIIEKEEFTFFFQPVVNMRTKEVFYYESLLRFKFQNKILPPFKYLEMIKGTFLYSKLSKKVVEKNIDILKKHKSLKLSINLSPFDLINESTIAILMNSDKDIADRLKIEIIETEDIRDYKSLKENVLKLKSKGYKIALDDFGKGYINFFYLTEIPADILKIDGGIIKNIAKDERYFKLCKSIASFAKEINIITVAEFVESEEIVNKLLETGIEYGQGYYFSKPKPLIEIIEGGNLN